MMEPVAIELREARQGFRGGRRDIDRHVAARIRHRRALLGMKIIDLADILGVHENQMSKYERAETRLSAGMLYQFARALAVDVGYFFDDIDAGEGMELSPSRREFLNLYQDFMLVKGKHHHKLLGNLARILSEVEERRGGGDGSHRRSLNQSQEP